MFNTIEDRVTETRQLAGTIIQKAQSEGREIFPAEIERLNVAISQITKTYCQLTSKSEANLLAEDSKNIQLVQEVVENCSLPILVPGRPNTSLISGVISPCFGSARDQCCGLYDNARVCCHGLYANACVYCNGLREGAYARCHCLYEYGCECCHSCDQRCCNCHESSRCCAICGHCCCCCCKLCYTPHRYRPSMMPAVVWPPAPRARVPIPGTPISSSPTSSSPTSSPPMRSSPTLRRRHSPDHLRDSFRMATMALENISSRISRPFDNDVLNSFYGIFYRKIYALWTAALVLSTGIVASENKVWMKVVEAICALAAVPCGFVCPPAGAAIAVVQVILPFLPHADYTQEAKAIYDVFITPPAGEVPVFAKYSATVTKNNCVFILQYSQGDKNKADQLAEQLIQAIRDNPQQNVADPIIRPRAERDRKCTIL